MNAHEQEHRDSGFAIGLITGALVGAGLTLWLAPRVASEIRARINDSAKDLRNRAAEQYEQASTRAGAAVDELTRKGQDVRDGMADAVVRGAREVERFAAAAKS